MSRLRRREAGHRVRAKLPELVRKTCREFGGGDNRLAELGGDLLQTRGEIDRRPDASEIETIAAADVAVHHLADMKRQPKAYWRFVLAGGRQLGDARKKFPRARQGAAANRIGFAIAGNRENRQQTVAHEFEHLAAVVEDRRHLAAEIGSGDRSKLAAANARKAR